MDLDRATPLLGGLTPRAFMRRHWQQKPLLVRAAVADAMPGFDRRRAFALAALDDVESRLVVHEPRGRWTRRDGPIPRRSLPALTCPGWTLLVQGVDLHEEQAHALLQRFRFVPDARLDDVMVSFATDGGGVGPHIDSYDVFLLQLRGNRRWRVGRVPKPELRDDVPLKMLASFEPSEEWLLEPGDMLYVPPGWGHDGVAVGECLTASIGFRAPAAAALGTELLERMADAARDAQDDAGWAGPLYRDGPAAATAAPASVPAALQAFAERSIERLLADRGARARALGELLSEPKPGTAFEAAASVDTGAALTAGVVLDRRTRMLYDDDHVFINGESFRAGARDAALMRELADARGLDARGVSRLGSAARELLADWMGAGWCRAAPTARPETAK